MTMKQIEKSIDKIVILRIEGNFLKAKELALKFLNNSSLLKESVQFAQIHNELGLICFNLGELELSEEFYEQAIQLYSKLGNVGGIAHCYGGIGNIYLVKSDKAKAIAYLEDAIELYSKIDDIEGIARNKSNLGLLFVEVSDYLKAIEFFEEALNFNEQLGNSLGIATNLGNFGIVYYYLLDFERAIEYFEKAIQIYQELGNINERLILLGNIGNVYLVTKKYDQCIRYYEEALQLSILQNNQSAIATNYGNLGVVNKDLQNYDTAIEFYKKSLKLHKVLDKKISMAINYSNLAEIYILKKDYETAQKYLDKSILVGTELQNNQILQESYKLQSEIFESTRKYKKSIKFFKEYILLKETIQTEESLQRAVLFDEKRKIDFEDKQRQLKLARFQEQEKLLHNILPINIADRILQNETFIADFFDSVSVLFMDLVGFTPLSSMAPPKQLVYLLDTIFTKADEIIEKYGLEKIKTIGDGYLAVANLSKPIENHQQATAFAAIELLKTMKDFEVTISNEMGDTSWIQDKKVIEIRIGIHTGEVVAGIIGKNKYTYDLWGDAVNVASRMESHSEAGRIHISEEFARSIEANPEFSVIPRGEISIKGKGIMNTYWLEKRK